MTQIMTAAQMRSEANDLMERALHVLDCAGENMAAIHLDYAIETLGLRAPHVRSATLPSNTSVANLSTVLAIPAP